jgi:hypothetical protein
LCFWLLIEFVNESLNIYKWEKDEDELLEGIMFIFFVFWVFWSLSWFHCNLFIGSNFQMGHFYYQCCWFLQATWKDLTSLAIRYEKISPQICITFSLSQMDLLSGNYLVFSCCTMIDPCQNTHENFYFEMFGDGYFCSL